MSFEINALVKAMQKVRENDLTQDVIIPVLRNMDFHHVEFFGGQNEIGKDILCFDYSKLKKRRLTVAQVKHFRFNNKASDSKSFQTVLNQLIAGFSKHMPFSDGTMYAPYEAYLITTYPVDSQTLLSRLYDHPNLKDRTVHIIDGPRLAELIIEHYPDAAKRLLGLNVEITSAIHRSLNNEILLAALGYDHKKEINEIYTDIDFSLGKITTELFFNAEFKPIKKEIALDESDWPAFKRDYELLRDEYAMNFLFPGIVELERNIKDKVEAHQTWKKKDEELHLLFEARFSEKNDLEKQLDKSIARLKNLEIQQKEAERQREFLGNAQTSEPKYLDLIQDIMKQNATLKMQLDYKTAEVEKAEILFKSHHRRADLPVYRFQINGELLYDQIKAKRQWIEERIDSYNHNKSHVADLKEFLFHCQKLIDCASIIFSNNVILSSLTRQEINKKYRDNLNSTRFTLPVEKIFDTGINFTVLGDAGAGKTTSLQMYALKNKSNPNKTFAWLPLSRVVQGWLKLKKQDKPDPDAVNLIEGIVGYLSTMSVEITATEFLYQISKNQFVLLLDGVDEAVKSASWLIPEIKSFADKYKANVQLIISSRQSGEYLNDLPFFAVTLLPFTSVQRDRFIKNWFNNDETFYNEVIEHVNKKKVIGDIIKTPLLATTLCVIAENKLPLPATEIKLYDERLSLLTGYYDSVKGIQRRTNSTPQTLELIAQKLAFYLHRNNQRDDYIDKLKQEITTLMVNKMSLNAVQTAIDELADPCNILVPMTGDGKFGFGHLRYQEHLVAKEIINNRGIDIIPLLKNSWWLGPMKLFSQMNQSLEWLLHDLGKRNYFTTIKPALSQLIDERPLREQHRLRALLDEYMS